MYNICIANVRNFVEKSWKLEAQAGSLILSIFNNIKSTYLYILVIILNKKSIVIKQPVVNIQIPFY